MSYQRMQQNEKPLEGEVSRLLSEAEQTDTAEDKRYGRTSRGEQLLAELGRPGAGRECPEGRRAFGAGSPTDPAGARSITDSESRIIKGPDGFVTGLQETDCDRARVAANRRPSGDAANQRQETTAAHDRHSQTTMWPKDTCRVD